MKVNGIIAEYNPFHNGHLYQLEESRKITGADYTIIVMSGDFVQRGAPAMADKHLRTEMALRCGADLVLELPVLYAVSSAESFASGAAALLDRLGVVTHLCFGSECGDEKLLEETARILLEETDEYRTALREGLKQGLSYPGARSKALSLRKDFPLLSGPNDILGTEYIRALLKRHSSIRPLAIKRLGAGYHDGAPLPLSPKKKETEHSSHPFCSALGIRQALRQGNVSPARYMPRESHALLLAWMKEKKPLYPDAFSSVLYYKLLTEKKCGYDQYLDLSSDLSDRIRNRLNEFTGFEAFCDLLKTKNLTHTRISRCLIHILLNIEKEHLAMGKALDYTPYARILGFRKAAAPLLHAIKAHTASLLISKLADGEKQLPPDACRMLRQDILAGEIYRGILYSQTQCPPPGEYSLSPVIL